MSPSPSLCLCRLPPLSTSGFRLFLCALWLCTLTVESMRVLLFQEEVMKEVAIMKALQKEVDAMSEHDMVHDRV